MTRLAAQPVEAAPLRQQATADARAHKAGVGVRAGEQALRDQFARLVRQHTPSVIALIRRRAARGVDAEDVAQEVFCKAWQAIRSGERVQDFRATGGLPLLTHLAEEKLARGEIPLSLLRDILELRRLLAVEVLALVAERGTREDLNGLRAHLRLLREQEGDELSFMALDLAFARKVVLSTHNVALSLLYNTVERLVESNPLARPAFLVNTDNALVVYEKLLELLDQRDVERVRSVSRTLLLRMDRRTLDKLDPSGALRQPSFDAADDALEADASDGGPPRRGRAVSTEVS